MIGLSPCEECGTKTANSPKPVRDKYEGKHLCDKCKDNQSP